MSLKQAAEAVRAAGRGKDTELVHLTRREVAGLHALAKAAGGELTRNPKTGMPEAGFLDSLLPTLLGAGAMLIPGMQPIGAAAIGAATGAMTNKQDPLMGAVMGGIGGYGGAGLGAGLQGAGAGAAQQAAIEGVQSAALPASELTAQGAANVTAGANHAAADATQAFLQKPFYEQAGAGLTAAVQNPGQFVEGMGGVMPTLKSAGMAAAPVMYDRMMPDAGGTGEIEKDGDARKYRYDAGFTGGEAAGPGESSERVWFRPQYTRLAEGGEVGLSAGGFVIPADVVSMLGNGSSDAGLEVLAKHLGAQPIEGPGDGMSDSIPARIDGAQPAAVARQEAYLTPAQVRAAGGEAKLQELLTRVRQAAHGTKRQQRPVQPEQVLT